MIDVNELEPFFNAEELNVRNEQEQIEQFYGLFVVDFVQNDLVVNGKKVKIFHNRTKIPGLTDYPETFAHIVTRELKTQKERFFEIERANRIHWIKPILLSHPCRDVKYFKWRDERNVCKEYYWLLHKKFIVVLKQVSADIQFVTAFCVDDDEKLKYWEWYQKFNSGESDCK